MPAGNIVIENARINYLNFEGREGQYNRAGQRNFHVFLDDEVADQMLQDGWNVKYLKVREEGDTPQAHVEVGVEFGKGRPPLIVLMSSRGRTTLGEDECELIDIAEIRKVDLIIRPYPWSWPAQGTSGIKAYLKCIYVTLEEDVLSLKYSDVPEIGSRQALEGPLVIQGASEGPRVIQGQVIRGELER